MFVGCVCMFGLLIVQQMLRFVSYPTTIRVIQREERPLEFPAVTICAMNLYKKSIIEQHQVAAEVLDNLHAAMLDTRDEEFIKRRWDEEPFDWEHVYLLSAHQTDVIRVFSFGGEEFDVQEHFTHVWTELGRCFTFNHYFAKRRFKTTRSGPKSGFYFRFNVQQEEYYFGVERSPGFKVLIHEASEYPNVLDNGFAVSPGTSNYVSIYKHTKQDLPPPNEGSECRADEELKTLKHFPVYSVSGCDEECLIEYMYERCGCRYIFSPSANYRTCNVVEYMECVEPGTNEFFNNFTASRPCFRSCESPCKTSRYHPKLSSSTYLSDYAMDKLLTGLIRLRNETRAAESVRKNSIELYVFYETMVHTIDQTVQSYTFAQLGGEIGGLMGLCLGASIMTVMEFFEFCVLLITDKLRAGNRLTVPDR